MLFFETDYMDVATLSEPAHITSGVLKVYKSNTASLQECVTDVVTCMPSAVFCAVRLRQPTCVSVEMVGGHLFQKTTTNYAMPVMRRDTSIIFHIVPNREIKYSRLHFQFALSYSALNGARRTRIFNISVDVTNDKQLLYSGINYQPALMGLISKRLVPSFTHSTNTAVLTGAKERSSLQKALEASYSDILKMKPHLTADNLLPAYFYGLTQYQLFNKEPTPVDYRTSLIFQLNNYSNTLFNVLIPILYRVDTPSSIQQVQLSAAHITANIHIMVRQFVFVIVPSDINTTALQECVGCSSLDEVEGIIELKSIPMRDAIDCVTRLYKLPVVFVVSGTEKYNHFLSNAYIFDRTSPFMQCL